MRNLGQHLATELLNHPRMPYLKSQQMFELSLTVSQETVSINLDESAQIIIGTNHCFIKPRTQQGWFCAANSFEQAVRYADEYIREHVRMNHAQNGSPLTIND